MIYLVIDSEGERNPMLVSCSDAEEANERLSLTEGQNVVGSFTVNDLRVLLQGSFVVVTS